MTAQEVKNKIKSGNFNWKRDSYLLAEHYPEMIDPERYNWDKHSWAVARHCPEKFDAERYNWEKDSWAVAQHCPQHFDAEKYNWKDFSWAVAYHAYELIDTKKFLLTNGKFDPTSYLYCIKDMNPTAYAKILLSAILNDDNKNVKINQTFKPINV